jgi:hypothetical protein
MEPVLIVLISGVLGGIILAALIAGNRITLRSDHVDRQLEPASPSLINMAHIPVKGGGGLGIVAAVILVALVDPRLRLAMAIAALSGVVFAAMLIARRRARGPLTSAGDDDGPHSLLGLDRDQMGSGDPARLPPSQPGPGGLRLVLPPA